jgi:hypothetical protein
MVVLSPAGRDGTRLGRGCFITALLLNRRAARRSIEMCIVYWYTATQRNEVRVVAGNPGRVPTCHSDILNEEKALADDRD